MIGQVRLKNWMCYRGEHVLNLESKAYAVVARYESDAGRSNRGGKSAFFESIEFALTGRLNKDRRNDFDGWITTGEREGLVFVSLVNGLTITRSRTRGSSTKLTVQWREGSETKTATQDDAQKIIERRLGFDADDYRTVAYFPQGTMSRLIRTEPEKVFDIIRSWLGLAKAEEAEDLVTERAKKHLREVKILKERMSAISDWQARSPVPSDADTKKLIERTSVLRKKLAEKKQERMNFRKLDELHTIVAEFDELVEDGKAVAKELEAYPADLAEQVATREAEVRDLYARVALIHQEESAKKNLVTGSFDGACPVSNIVCPATSKINSNREANVLAHELILKSKLKADGIYNQANAELKQLNEKLREYRQKQARRKMLRERVAEIRPDVIAARNELKAHEQEGDDIGNDEEKELKIESEIDRIQEQLEKLSTEVAVLQSRSEQARRHEVEIQDTRTKIDSHAKLAATATQAKGVLRATQRRIAEKALDAIGSRANDMLRHVDLKLDVQWEREGKGLAKACEMCGTSFPSSAKVKECENCGSERGQHVVQKLEFKLSERSGAADDWGGISLQLAAGSWLLASRHSFWATAMIDEPFAQMDKASRRAAAKQLINLVGDSSFKQVFVVSHSQETTDMYAARINIYVAKDGTRSIEIA